MFNLFKRKDKYELVLSVKEISNPKHIFCSINLFKRDIKIVYSVYSINKDKYVISDIEFNHSVIKELSKLDINMCDIENVFKQCKKDAKERLTNKNITESIFLRKFRL